MFHIVFQKNPKALRGLCAALLHMRPEEIRSVEVLNPLEFKTLPTDKHFVLDLKVMLNDARILSFEVQVIDERDWTERSLTYACRTFDQLQKGETYLEAAIKTMAQNNEYISDAAQAIMLQYPTDTNLRRTLAIRLGQLRHYLTV